LLRKLGWVYSNVGFPKTAKNYPCRAPNKFLFGGLRTWANTSSLRRHLSLKTSGGPGQTYVQEGLESELKGRPKSVMGVVM